MCTATMDYEHVRIQGNHLQSISHISDYHLMLVKRHLCKYGNIRTHKACVATKQKIDLIKISKHHYFRKKEDF
jgi:hypothetical protein